MAESRPPADPVLDIRVRWHAGRVLLSLAGALALVAILRPFAAETAAWLKGGYALTLGFAVVASALLSSLGGRRRPEMLAFQAFLVLSVDAAGQLLTPAGIPVWPLMTVLLAALAVSEGLAVTLGFAALASVLSAAEVARVPPPDWSPAAAAAFGYVALVLAIDRALAGEKRRLSATLAQLARLQHGIDQLEEDPGGLTGPASNAAEALRQVTVEARRARQLDRAGELDEALGQLLEVVHAAIQAHAVVYFDVDRQREIAHMRAWCGPSALVTDCTTPLGTDPFGFVLDREQPFYATDFKRLLWQLPWYRGQVKIGSLLAVPVRAGDVTVGVLVADRLEIQSFTGREPQLLKGFAALAADAIRRTRASLGREELDAEFKAVYPVSQRLATLAREPEVRELLLRSARHIVGFDGAAVVVTDESRTRYVVEAAVGWPSELLKRTVGLEERTWAAWVLRSAEEAYLLDHLSGHETRMPVLVLDERASAAESLLAVPLRAGDRTLGALILTGERGVFDASSRRVLEILANQAAATLSLIQEREKQRQLAVRDALTGLYNRRAFNELLVRAIGSEDRRQNGSLGLILLDIDHFKKLNDTYGHPAGDAALRSLARLLLQHLRKSDQAARYGGEEFVVILPGADEERSVQAAERLRDALEHHRFVHEAARIPLSASLGVAVWPADGREADALLAAADRSLYAAKEGGRNRVVAASSLPAAPSAASS